MLIAVVDLCHLGALLNITQPTRQHCDQKVSVEERIQSLFGVNFLTCEMGTVMFSHTCQQRWKASKEHSALVNANSSSLHPREKMQTFCTSELTVLAQDMCIAMNNWTGMLRNVLISRFSEKKKGYSTCRTVIWRAIIIKLH